MLKTLDYKNDANWFVPTKEFMVTPTGEGVATVRPGWTRGSLLCVHRPGGPRATRAPWVPSQEMNECAPGRTLTGPAVTDG